LRHGIRLAEQLGECLVFALSLCQRFRVNDGESQPFVQPVAHNQLRPHRQCFAVGFGHGQYVSIGLVFALSQRFAAGLCHRLGFSLVFRLADPQWHAERLPDGAPHRD
jgi:hypothetical protein